MSAENNIDSDVFVFHPLAVKCVPPRARSRDLIRRSRKSLESCDVILFNDHFLGEATI